MDEINYQTDILKHIIRTQCWLPACRERRKAIKRRLNKVPLRYFTFCAADAVDVFMLVRAGLLKRSETTGRLESVYFCDKDDKAFAIIADLIGSPQQGFNGIFHDIVLFQDTPDTLNKTLYNGTSDPEGEDEEFSEETRHKLKIKDAHLRLQKAFPFDIINLDVYGAMFPNNEPVIGRLTKSIIQMLKWQSEGFYADEERCQEFTLLLTSHISPRKINSEALVQLSEIMKRNIETLSAFRDGVDNLYGYSNVDRIIEEHFDEFASISLSKFIIEKALLELGWDVEHGSIFLYDRQDKQAPGEFYQMMHSVSTFRRLPNVSGLNSAVLSRYSEAVTRLVKEPVKRILVPSSEAELRAIQEDLQSIVEFRDSGRFKS